jgi:4-amino-4-deoxy-L-arabinose transferase-like glycosyltransferase
MKSDGTWDEIDVADIFRELEDFFGFTCTHDAWKEFFGCNIRTVAEWDLVVGPRLTFGALAQFIADKTDAISLTPITVFGSKCAPAGVFMGIQQIASRAHGKPIRFGPSTRVIDVLRGEALDRFWTQLRWMTQHSVSALPWFWRGVTGYAICIGFLSVFIALLAAITIGGTTLLVSAILVCILLYVLAAVFKHLANPLPTGIITFRDVSMMISESDCDAVRE